MNENLGPAERIIDTLLSYKDHMVHNRPGMIVPDRTSVCGVNWVPTTHKVENGQKVVYRLDKTTDQTRRGKKIDMTVKVRLGVLQDNKDIIEAGRKVGTYRAAGLFTEVAVWMYKQVSEVWKLDNEFAARWASYAFTDTHRDLQVVLAAFMMVQSRKGDPVLEEGKVIFRDDDFRDVGEAMVLTYKKEKGADGKDRTLQMNPKLLLRIFDLLTIPEIAEINRTLGFGKSARNAFMGRWGKATEKWLRYREENPRVFAGLLKDGYRTTVMDLARRTGYKPTSPKFFSALRWQQDQAKDGHRGLAIGEKVGAAETWEGLTEAQICEKIVQDKIGYKRVTGLLPKSVGLTRAIMSAVIESGGLSDKDIVILAPTLEDLGLLEVQEIRERFQRAARNAEDMRAANIALRIKSKEAQDTLQAGAETAAQKAVEEDMRGIFVHVIVDISGSMQGSIEKAISYLTKLLVAIPLDKLRVSVFHQVGREVKIQHASAKGVEGAFRGIQAGGGTHYGQGVQALKNYKPGPGEDLIMIFVGDEECSHPTFAPTIRESGLNPMAFGLIRVLGTSSGGHGTAVRNTAAQLGIPCFQIDERTFADTYAIPRTMRALIAATPVGVAAMGAAVASKRVSLVDKILKTDLLQKPIWAS